MLSHLDCRLSAPVFLVFIKVWAWDVMVNKGIEEAWTFFKPLMYVSFCLVASGKKKWTGLWPVCNCV